MSLIMGVIASLLLGLIFIELLLSPPPTAKWWLCAVFVLFVDQLLF